MGRPLKIAMTISFIITAFIAIAMAFFYGSIEDIICFSVYFFIAYTIFFWLVYYAAKSIKKVETTAWKWINDEPVNTRAPKTYSERALKTDEAVLVEEKPGYKLYAIEGNGVGLFSEEYARTKGNLLGAGILIYSREDLKNLLYYIEVPSYPIPKREVERIYRRWRDFGEFDMVVLFYKNYEIACGDRKYISSAYSVDYSGLIVKEDKYFIRVFDHNCKDLRSKRKIIKFVNSNINKSEVGELYKIKTKLISFGKGKFLKNITALDHDMLHIFYSDTNTIYLYDVPFSPKPKDELIRFAQKMEKSGKPAGIVIENENYLIAAYRKNILKYITVGIDMDSGGYDDYLIVIDKSTEQSKSIGIKLKKWTAEEVLKEGLKLWEVISKP